MHQLKILKTKEVRELKEALQQQFGFSLTADYAYLQNDHERIFIVSKEVTRIDMEKLRIDRIGLYLGEFKHGQLRLSKEGAQLLAAQAVENKIELQNVVELDSSELKEYFQGRDVVKELGSESRLILLRYGADIFGCARYKENKILNFLSKIHYGEVIV